MNQKREINKRKKKTGKSIKKSCELQDIRGSLMGTFLSILFLLVLLSALFILIYILYMNIPGEVQQGNVQVGSSSTDEKLALSAVKQFYSNTKFNHNVILYEMDVNCDEQKKKRIMDAFGIVSEKVNKLTFKESFNNGVDIVISCSEESKENIDEEHFIAGEGGAKEIVQTGKYNVINEGIIYLYESQDFKTAKCNYPDVELHELMHVFGFQHSEDKSSLMYPYLESCNQVLDDSIIDELNRLYSEENLADLFFEDVWTVKRGRYLDFNLTIKNSGVVNALDVHYSIIDDGELVETRKLDEEVSDISYGAGIIISISNLRLLNRNSKEISFILDKRDDIKELDEDNNIAIARFGIN